MDPHFSSNQPRLSRFSGVVPLGLTPQHISAIEQDKRAPALPSLARMAEELGVTVDFLVAGKEGVVTGVIPAVKADRRLSLKSKRAVIALLEELYSFSAK